MLLHNIVKVVDLFIEDEEENKIVGIITESDKDGRQADYLLVDKNHGELRETLNVLTNGPLLLEVSDYNGWNLSKRDWEE